MSIECQPTPIPCTDQYVNPPSILRIGLYGLHPIIRPCLTHMIEADVIIDRSLYDTVQCECVQEYDLRIALGLPTCIACRIPNTVALNCDPNINLCSCIIDVAETTTYNGYPTFTNEQDYFSYILNCIRDIDPNNDLTPISNAIVRLANFRDATGRRFTNIAIDPFEATFLVNTDPSRIFSAAVYELDVSNDRETFACCDGDKTARYSCIISVTMCVRFSTYDITPYVNTKEDYEILRGLFLGRYMHEQLHDEHIIKRAKTIDII